MPFKDLATVESIIMRTFTEEHDVDARTNLRRLMEVSMGVVVPVEELLERTLSNAVALMDLNEAIEKNGEVSGCT